MTVNRDRFPRIYGVPDVECLDSLTYESLFKAVTTERKKRVCAFFRREDACRSLVSEALLRFALIDAGIGANDIELLKQNEFGKPYIPHGRVHFNLSHSGSWVVLAIDSEEIGIDIEKVGCVDEAIAHRFFAKEELEFLSQCTSRASWIDSFYKIWVLKESYIKAIGKGLSCPLGDFSVIPFDESVDFIEKMAILPRRNFKLYSIDKDYRCALCCLRSFFPEEIKKIDSKVLVGTILKNCLSGN
ncbi:MAG: 4'-phosphopantetheinyl transferase superfamily protein [Chitinivibrionales bacterium]|nr:4'-phosphopantetheinyl transferase superfamily protein [Chitinivibrionales bacterium]